VVRKAKRTEEQARGLHSFDGRDQSMELEEFHARMAGIDDEHAAEAGKLS
jgi:hypothetical protein